MAAVTKATVPGYDGSNPAHPQIAGEQYAGEDIAACDLVYCSASDGKWYRASGAAANTAAAHPRLCPFATKSGRPITVFQPGIRYKAADSGLTPGAIYFLSGTVLGGLDTTASTGDAAGTCQAVSDTDVVLIRW